MSLETEDERRQKIENRKERKHIAIENSDLRKLMSDAAFMRFMWKVIAFTEFNKSPFSLDPHSEAHLIGKADVGRFLMAQMVEANEQGVVEFMLSFYKKSNGGQ